MLTCTVFFELVDAKTACRNTGLPQYRLAAIPSTYILLVWKQMQRAQVALPRLWMLLVSIYRPPVTSSIWTLFTSVVAWAVYAILLKTILLSTLHQCAISAHSPLSSAADRGLSDARVVPHSEWKIECTQRRATMSIKSQCQLFVQI